MATLLELAGIRDSDDYGPFVQKIRAAAVIKATTVIDSTAPAATLLDWAQRAIVAPNKAGDDLVAYVVGSNADATLAQIYSATDNQIQNKVNAAVDALYGA